MAAYDEMDIRFATALHLYGGVAECLQLLAAGKTSRDLRATPSTFYPNHLRNADMLKIAHAHDRQDIGLEIMTALRALENEETRFAYLTAAARGVMQDFETQGLVPHANTAFDETLRIALATPVTDSLENPLRSKHLYARLEYETSVNGLFMATDTENAPRAVQEETEFYREGILSNDDGFRPALMRYVETRNAYAENISSLYVNEATQMLNRVYHDIGAYVGMGKNDPETLSVMQADHKRAEASMIFAQRLFPTMAPGFPVPDAPTPETGNKKPDVSTPGSKPKI